MPGFGVDGKHSNSSGNTTSPTPTNARDTGKDPLPVSPNSRSGAHVSLRLLAFAVVFVALAIVAPRAVPRLSLVYSQLVPSASSTSKIVETDNSMAPPSYETELKVAQLAVQRAAILTDRVFNEKAKGAVDKKDKSPVTIGDFGAQALIISALKKHWPDDEIVAEEESHILQEEANTSVKDEVWKLVSETKLDDEEAETFLGGSVKSVEDMLKLLDMGKSAGGRSGRIWTIDPIDGTKGFLRGGQYAVCLALMVDGDVKVGVLGCPNLPIDDAAAMTAEIVEESGVLFSAVQGHGSTSRTMTTGVLSGGKPIEMRNLAKISDAAFCESVESGHSAHSEQSLIASRLGITASSVRMDSQAKYASVARGAGDIYLRLPVNPKYQEKIWDHAAGYAIVKEAGGKISDVNGDDLDFGRGRTLSGNKGVIAAPSQWQGEVLRVVKEVLSEKANKTGAYAE